MSPRFSEGFIAKVNDATDMLSLVNSATALSHRGGKYWGLCPFHAEKSPSFSVDIDRKFYYCFGCERGGDAIKFVQEYYKYTFSEAVEYLAEKAHINIEYASGETRNEGAYNKKKLYYEINKAAGNFFFMALKNTPAAQEYLKRRELKAETVKAFAIGYAPKEGRRLYGYLKNKGYADDDLQKLGLIRTSAKGSYDYFRDRLMFPILDAASNLVGFGGRVLQNEQPKYLNSPETPVFYKKSTLFNLNNAKKHIGGGKLPLIVTEGYMDVVSLYDKGIQNACASLGTAFSEEHAKLIRRYTNDVVLCYDGDSAGINAAVRAIGIFETAGLDVKVLLLPDGEDPDSFVKKYGKEKFEENTASAVYATDFLIKMLSERYDITDIVQKARFLKEACACVAKNRDEIKWDYYSKQLSLLTDTDQTVVKQQIRKSAEELTSNTSSANGSLSVTHENNAAITAEERISPVEEAVLKFVMQGYDNYRLFTSIKGSSTLFSSDSTKLLFKNIEEAYTKQKNVDVTQALMYNTTINHLVARLSASDSVISESELREYTKNMLTKYYESELYKLSQRISDFSGQNTEDLAILMKEFTYLKNEMLQIKNGGGTFE